MRKIICLLFAVSVANAQEAPSTTVPEAAAVKITTKDAKKECKDEGKKGPELIECIKAKKGQKE
jgi:hypothetical protein